MQNFVVFLSYINKNQPRPSSHLPPHPTLQSVTEPLFEFPESDSKSIFKKKLFWLPLTSELNLGTIELNKAKYLRSET